MYVFIHAVDTSHIPTFILIDCFYLYMTGGILTAASFTDMDWLFPAWKTNDIYHKVRDEITYPLLNTKGATVAFCH